MHEPTQIARFKHLTETVLPALAREHHWPIRLDHCFKRICLDHAFSDVWYHHLKKPAERHLTGEPSLAPWAAPKTSHIRAYRSLRFAIKSVSLIAASSG